MSSSHHFVCSRLETVYLAAGTYVVDVGARLNYYSQIEVFNGQLTFKLTQYDLSQTTLGNLPILRVSQWKASHCLNKHNLFLKVSIHHSHFRKTSLNVYRYTHHCVFEGNRSIIRVSAWIIELKRRDCGFKSVRRMHSHYQLKITISSCIIWAKLVLFIIKFDVEKV